MTRTILFAAIASLALTSASSAMGLQSPGKVKAECQCDARTPSGFVDGQDFVGWQR